MGSTSPGPAIGHTIFGIFILIMSIGQPLVAIFRPTPHAFIEKFDTTFDVSYVWHMCHRFVGYVLLLSGVLNCITGIVVLSPSMHNYSGPIYLIMAVLLAVLLLPVLGLSLFHQFKYGRRDPRPYDLRRRDEK